jgi:hypothetical protein
MSWRERDRNVEEGNIEDGQRQFARAGCGKFLRKRRLPANVFSLGRTSASYVAGGIESVVGGIDDRFNKLNEWADKNWVRMNGSSMMHVGVLP